jgi:hypothetical protein
MLIYYDANVNLTDNKENTALIVAAYYGNTEMVKLLIDNHSTLEKQDLKGFTALHCAAQNGNLDIADLLVTKGANIEQKNMPGYSALSVAVLNNNTKLTKYFIDSGADVNSRVSYSTRPLNIAKKNENDTIIGLLKDKGARLNRMPAFNYASINFDFSTSANDFMLGGGLGIIDTRYGLWLNTGYLARLKTQQVLENMGENNYYQYWEKRSYIYLSLTERLPLYSWQGRNSIGVGAGGQEIYTFGSYRGADVKPARIFIFAPQAMVYIRFQNLAFSFKYEYIDFKLADFSPHRFNFGIHFLLAGKLIKQPTKKVLWYI